MTSVRKAALPAEALLQAYVGTGAYTDCYAVDMTRLVSLSDFMTAFYTSPVFTLERWLLARLLHLPSTDQEALALANGDINNFAAWRVEARAANQTILAAGRTRSWLMAASPPSQDSVVTTLFFGSAVLPRRRGGLGWSFRALLGFHKVYSRVLLAAAVRRLA